MLPIIDELKRRHVIRTTIAYAAVAFIIMQLVEIVFPIFNFPQWTQQFIIILLLIGLPITIILAWMFDRTAGGIKRTEDLSPVSRTRIRVRYLLISVIAALTGMLIYQTIYERESGQLSILKIVPANSIAVLPFENLGSKEEDEYFSDGITEDIITELSKIKNLLVISRTSVMKYKGTKKSIQKIGAELGVASILEGSVRRAGDRVRITGQLIDAKSDQHLWAEKYDRELSDIFAVQDEVASSIASALRIELSDDESTRIADSQTESIEAYDLYLKGRNLYHTYDVSKLEESIKYFKQAIDIDPGYALPYTGIAKARVLLSYNLWVDRDQMNAWLVEAKQYAEDAVALSPTDPETVFTLGYYFRRIGEPERAHEYFRRTIAINPSHAHAYDEIGDVFLSTYGDLEGALEFYRNALERAPALAPPKYSTIDIMLKKGQINAALDYAYESRRMHPGSIAWIPEIHAALVSKLRYDESMELLLTAKQIFINNDQLMFYNMLLGISAIHQGDNELAEECIANIKETEDAHMTHHLDYLRGYKAFFDRRYDAAIGFFERLLNKDMIFRHSVDRLVVADIARYWKALAHIEKGEYQSALFEASIFRPKPSVRVNQLIGGDLFWAKQYYLKGIAYDGLDDPKNARENYEKFLKVWSEADNYLPEIVYTKERLQKLKGVS